MTVERVSVSGVIFSGPQKAAIVKAHLLDGVSISDLCDQHQIQPTLFHQWQNQLFENGGAAFERKSPPGAKNRTPGCQAFSQERSDRRTNGGERQSKKELGKL